MSAPQLAPGAVVGTKYRVGACIGYGASSATYQAAGADGREVVLKIFDPRIRQRADIMTAIEQVYAATNALPQDVAVPLYDAGYDAATGAPFSVSERIPFPSLAQLASQRTLTPEEVTNVVGVLAHLLDLAHSRRLFHHALKPTNVFVGFAQGRGVRVTDFGAGLSRTAVPTPEGYALSAPWMAPEQVQAGAAPGAAADVFAAGLLVFFAFTGRSYWRSTQGSFDAAGWQRELAAPRTPASMRARELGVSLNPTFDGVLASALALDPAQRFRSVGELAHAFEALVSSRVAEAAQATLAIPASALGLPSNPGDYPPPPVPTAGFAMGPQAAPNPAQYQAPPALPAAPPRPPPAESGVVAIAPQPSPSSPGAQPGYAIAPQPGYAQPAPAQPAPTTSASLGETAAGRPIDPAILQRRSSPNRLVPILVGSVAVLLLGGAVVAWVVMGKRSHSESAAQPASASVTAAAVPSPAAPPTTSASAESSAVPAADTAAPADTGDAAAPADADAGAAASDAINATFACDPECDEIKVDDKPIELGKPVELTPGKHVVTATKSGYVTARELVAGKAGDTVDKTFKLVAKPAAAAPASPGALPASTAAKAPCGKFLKRCK